MSIQRQLDLVFQVIYWVFLALINFRKYWIMSLLCVNYQKESRIFLVVLVLDTFILSRNVWTTQVETNSIFSSQTVDQFFALKVPMRSGELSSLFRGIDNAFQVYTKNVLDSLGNSVLIYMMSNVWLFCYLSWFLYQLFCEEYHNCAIILFKLHSEYDFYIPIILMLSVCYWTMSFFYIIILFVPST